MAFSMPYLAVSASAAQEHGWTNSSRDSYAAIIAAFHADTPSPGVVGVGTKSTSGNAQTKTVTISPTAGHLLVLGMTSYLGDYAQHAVSDGVNTWTRIGGTNSSGPAKTSLWYAKNCSGGSTTITIDAGSGGTSNYVAGTVLEIEGASVTSPFTSGEFQTDSAYLDTNPLTGSLTNGTPSSLFIAFTGAASGTLTINGTGTTSGSTWALVDTTNSQNSSSGATMAFSMPYLAVTAAAAQDHGWINSNRDSYAAIVAAFH